MHDLVPAGITISGTTTDARTPYGEPVHPAYKILLEKKKSFAHTKSTPNTIQQLVLWSGYPQRTVGVTPDMERGPGRFSVFAVISSH